MQHLHSVMTRILKLKPDILPTGKHSAPVFIAFSLSSIIRATSRNLALVKLGLTYLGSLSVCTQHGKRLSPVKMTQHQFIAFLSQQGPKVQRRHPPSWTCKISVCLLSMGTPCIGTCNQDQDQGSPSFRWLGMMSAELQRQFDMVARLQPAKLECCTQH